MGNSSNPPEGMPAQQPLDATDDAAAMDVVVEAYDPRPSTAEAAEHPGATEAEQPASESGGQTSAG